MTNLTHHLLELEEFSPESHHLASVLNQLVLASKLLSHHINRAGLTTLMGGAGTSNATNDDQQKLDVYANELFITLMKQSPYVKAVATEESNEIIVFDDDTHSNAEYVIYLDPVDGSSNIDVNVSIGTNFVIFKGDYLQPGKNAVAAGYVIYSSSTMFVYSSGKGVNGFTLDQGIGDYILSHPNLKFPDKPAYYSLNERYSPSWSSSFSELILTFKTVHHLNDRYVGSLVADFHRNLLKGGIFLYPADKKNPQGKLRLLYEGIPFAYLAEQAGGASSDGTQSILEIIPTEIHQRTPFFVGNTHLVEEITK